MKKLIVSLAAAYLVTSALAGVTEMPGAFIDGKYIPPEELPLVPKSSQAIPIQPYSHTQKIDQDKNLAPIASTPNAKEIAQARKIPAADAARLAAAKKWEETGAADALVGAGGAIEYPYGFSRPTITCAPLHVCSVALQDGESITSVSLGDTVRWLLQTAVAGNKPVMAIKPTQAGLSTNLMVTTDKGRVYYMHLVSSKTEYVPMVNWYDPASMTRDLRAEAEAAARQKAELEVTLAANKFAAEQARARRVVADQSVGSMDPTKLDFSYTCEGEANFKPTRVFANESHTFIQLPPDAKTSDAPAVFNISNNETELLNSRLNNGYYVIDGKPSKISLVLGVGNKAQTVKCEKKQPGGFTWGRK